MSIKLLGLATLASISLAENIPEMYQRTNGGDRKFLSGGDMKAFKAKNRDRFSFEGVVTPNDRPMIGVLTQPLPANLKNDSRFEGKTSYIMASYINHLESAGARTVPLIFDGDLQ